VSLRSVYSTAVFQRCVVPSSAISRSAASMLLCPGVLCRPVSLSVLPGVLSFRAVSQSVVTQSVVAQSDVAQSDMSNNAVTQVLCPEVLFPRMPCF
jgi:hypothetical protein